MGNITFDLGVLPRYDAKKSDVRYDGVSVLVNDVERFRGYGDDDDGGSGNLTWMWERHHLARKGREEVEEEVKFPEYFRFAYMRGSKVGDYTKAGKWDEEGRWIEMKEGASR